MTVVVDFFLKHNEDGLRRQRRVLSEFILFEGEDGVEPHCGRCGGGAGDYFRHSGTVVVVADAVR